MQVFFQNIAEMETNLDFSVMLHACSLTKNYISVLYSNCFSSTGKNIISSHIKAI